MQGIRLVWKTKNWPYPIFVSFKNYQTVENKYSYLENVFYRWSQVKDPFHTVREEDTKSLLFLVYIAPRWDDVKWALNWAGDLATLHDRFRSQWLLVRAHIPAYWKQADTLLIMHNGGLKWVSLFCLKSWYHMFYRIFYWYIYVYIWYLHIHI